MMETLEKHSIASFLKVMLTVIWYFQITAIVLIIIVAAIGPTPMESRFGKVHVKLDHVHLYLNGTAFYESNFGFKDSYYEILNNHYDSPDHNAEITEATGIIKFKDENPSFYFSLIFGLGFLLLTMVIIYKLRKILSELMKSSPFIIENAARIKYIAFAIVAIGILKTIADLTFALLFSDKISIPGVYIINKIGFPMDIMLLGCLILIIAEIFRQGAILQEEQKLTI